MGDRPIVGQIFFAKMVFLEGGMTEQLGLELIMKDTGAERLVYHGILSKSADKHCLR